MEAITGRFPLSFFQSSAWKSKDSCCCGLPENLVTDDVYTESCFCRSTGIDLQEKGPKIRGWPACCWMSEKCPSQAWFQVLPSSPFFPDWSTVSGQEPAWLAENGWHAQSGIICGWRSEVCNSGNNRLQSAAGLFFWLFITEVTVITGTWAFKRIKL